MPDCQFFANVCHFHFLQLIKYNDLLKAGIKKASLDVMTDDTVVMIEADP